MFDLNNIQIEASGNEEIIQNIRMICTTPAGTVVFDRDFGIDHSILDQPVGIAKANLTAEYISKISKYEPRAKVKEILINSDSSGTLIPKVVIELV